MRPAGVRLDDGLLRPALCVRQEMGRALLILAFLLVASAAAAQPKGVGTLPRSPIMPVVRGDSLMDFVSDAQSPLLIEEIKLPANHNDSARSMIVSSILADRPNAIFTLGDMVSLGFYHSTWKSFDSFLDRAGKAGIPLYPLLGNHELIFFASYGADEFYTRFPWFRRTGYAVRVGPVALAMLNSNFDQLSKAENARQMAWLDSTLAAFESDTSVGIVFVTCHHPPYTNSTIVSPS